MPWNRNALSLISDPCKSTKYAMVFAVGRSPAVRFGPDIYAEIDTELADESLRTIRLADPKRTCDLPIVGWLTRYELLQYRLFREHGHYVALFPNYWTDTCIVTHFEDTTASEIGLSPALSDGAGPITPTYEAGKCGGAVTIGTPGHRLRYVSNPALPSAGTLGFWFKVPADATIASLGLFRAPCTASGPFKVGWDSTEADIVFRYGAAQTACLHLGKPTLIAGEWHHICIRWGATASPTTAIFWDGALCDSTPGITMPTFGGAFDIGFDGTYDMSISAVDEIRLDPSRASDTDVGAQYDRLASEDELVIQEQSQGHYFKVVRDEFYPVSGAEADKWAGTISLRGAWSDADQRVSRVSTA